MKIGIDVPIFGSAHNDKGGVYHYIFYLLQGLKEIDRENTYKIWFHFFRHSNISRYKEVCDLLNLNGKDNFKVIRSCIPNYRGWFLRLPVEVFIGSVDIFHGPAHFVMPTFSGKSIVTIHDVDFLKIPEYLNPEWVQYKEKYTRLSLKRADVIITVSNYIKNEIIRYFGVPEEKIRVVYHGASDHFTPLKDNTLINRVLERYGIKIPYILFVGTFHKNKNLIRLLEAFYQLKLSYSFPHRLVLAGGKGELNKDVIQRIAELKIEKLVSLTGFVPIEDLPIIYQGSALFVFPSLFEGFGIPVLEAMASGVPVIASNVCSLPEVVGEAGLLIDPLNVDLLAETMYRVLSNKELRDELIKKGFERVKLFTWVKTVKETMAIYKEACEK